MKYHQSHTHYDASVFRRRMKEYKRREERWNLQVESAKTMQKILDNLPSQSMTSSGR